ncbi:MAG: amylosucrase, partial [Xanthomonadaceae bacterium]|nr:amylosucrase [Xanthomonadaceae bacterium]
AALTALVAARRHRRWPANADVTVQDAADPGLLVVRRGDQALGVFNFAARATALDLAALDAGRGWTDLFSSGVAGTAATTCTLQPWATLWRVRGRV